MRIRVAITAAILGLAGIGVYAYAARKAWGPDLLADPLYRSGRASLCKTPVLRGDSVPAVTEDRGQALRLAGFEHSWEHRFDAATLAGGSVHVCSEYGSVQVHGVEGTAARIRVTMSDPFPGGADAIRATRISTSVRSDNTGLHVAIWQQTQGMSTFRSLLEQGARPVAANIVLELPNRGTYRVDVTANHQRITMGGIDVAGVIQGYLSPGADLDVGLGGELTLHLNNGTLKADWRRDAGVDFQGGTTATLRPLTSGTVEADFVNGDATLRFAGPGVGLDVTASAKPGPVTVDIGPTESSNVTASGTRARSAGYPGAARKVMVRASSGGGSVAIHLAR